ncbi:glycoside hydrolase superfamily [Cubamyces lactineus]|nr:glycoside hydrolase superfamily [Cubamyces lactineus]
MARLPILFAAFLWLRQANAVAVPSSPPANAATVDPSLVSVSIEFFAFPGYTQLSGTSNCLANLATLRGAQPAIRIGGTTQDRATYDPNLQTPVNYTVASPADAPTTLTYGPSFLTLASQLKGEVTVGLNRQLNNQANSLAAGSRAKQSMGNLFAIELGNEPDLYASSSPIASGTGWSQSVDIASEAKWFTAMAPALGNIFQGAVYLSWNTRTLVSSIGSAALSAIKTISRHSYPQSACGGASTNLPSLMSHSGIVSYVSQYKAEASAAHGAGKKFFLGETNSATCGGGGISPTFGAGLWIIDYVLQSALIGVDRLYFHHGTIGNCAYCWWGQNAVYSPYYGAVFVSEFLGTDGAKVAMLDDGSTAIAIYAVYSASNAPLRLLISNSNYFDGSGARTSASVAFTGLSTSSGTKQAKRLTAPNATSRVDQGAPVTIGGDGTFGTNCARAGTENTETVAVSGNALTVTVQASEALIVYL